MTVREMRAWIADEGIMRDDFVAKEPKRLKTEDNS